jgi:polysaccharide deacetylase family protein (PEP-CTERM system associated)
MTGAIVNAMTIDVEDYFHVSVFDGVIRREDWDRQPSRVEASTSRLLDLLAAHGVKATCFVLGWVAERFPRLVARIAAEGHEVASHGYWHRLVYRQTPDDFRADLRRAREVIEQASGRSVRGYRAPSFSITTASLWALDVLADEGYAYDASIFPVRHDRYGIPAAPRHLCRVSHDARSLVEAPGSTVRLAGVNVPVAGGGYFRLLPYAWTRWGIARRNRVDQQPAIFYLHPWEIDPDQPRLPASRLGRFRHYRNLDRTESRLRQLLTDFRFAPLSTVLDADLPTADLRGLAPRAVA